MPVLATAPPEPFVSFERGIDRESPRTNIEKGGYEDAENILLSCQPNGGKHVCTLLLDQELDAAVTWPTGNAIFVVPYTFSTYSSNVLSFSSHLLIARDTGQAHRYDLGAPGTVTSVRRGFDTNNKLWTHAVYDQWLLTMNGRDAPMKYGQHFLGDSQLEARPFLFPLGAKPVSPMGATIAGEAWTFSAAESAFVADASVPGGSRVHTQSVKVAGGQNAFNSWTTARNFLSGPYPYGGTDFAGSDFLVVQVNKPAGGAANIRIRFGDDAGANYFEFTQSVSNSTSWQTLRLLRSAAATTGSPSWGSIKRVTFFNDDATLGDVVYFDDCYFLYANAPPALQMAVQHKTRVVGGGVPVAGDSTTPALANLYFSRAAFPDEFPGTNVQLIASGNNALTRANQVTAIREFGASVLVGTPHAIVAWTLDSAGTPQQQTVTNEHGIDAHRGVIETPNGALLFMWQRGLYVIRSTWRAVGGVKISPYLKDLWLEEPWWAVSVFDEHTQTIRVWFREKPENEAAPTKNNQGLILDYVRAQELGEGVWPATMSQMADFATPAYVNGLRETLYCRFDDPQIYRLGVNKGLDSVTGAPTTTHSSRLRLPWMCREPGDKVTKWGGLQLHYAATTPVLVKIRYASNPEEFDTAAWTDLLELPAAPEMQDQARVPFGRPSRWAQVEFSTDYYGMELFPPISLYGLPTARQP